jgi:hypothetical protein
VGGERHGCDEHLLALPLMLKSYQRMGCLPRLEDVPEMVLSPSQGKVDGVDGVVRGEFRHDRPPAVPGLWPTVYQHDWRAAAAGRVVHTDAVDVGELVSEGVLELGIVLDGAA